jgi:hypothetical protein
MKIDDRTRKALANREFREQVRRVVQDMIDDGSAVPTGETRRCPITGKLLQVYDLKDEFEKTKAKKAGKTTGRKGKDK